MSENAFTLLEVHLGDGDIQIGPFGLNIAPEKNADTAGAPGKTETSGEADEIDTDVDADGDSERGVGCGCCSAKSVGGVLLLVGLLAAAAVAAAKLRGGDEEVPPGIAGDA